MPTADPATPNPYADLEIRIFPRQSEGYPVEFTLDGQQRFRRGYLATDILPWLPSADLNKDGQRLFDFLFADPVLQNAWAEARGRSLRRRIRLWIDVAAAELHSVPWELLREGPVMLSAQANTPFSRYLPIALPWSGPVEERPIRVLVLISAPDDLEKDWGLALVDAASERHNLESAFADVGHSKVRADFLEAPVTSGRLERALREGYHALHYLGHGSYSSKNEQAALFMQDEAGNTHLLRDHQLVSMLAGQSVQPRLIFLAACQSATRSMADALTGLGPKLVTLGVPAVVAMQEKVTLDTARQFSATFYRQLFDHGLVDLAINEARSAPLTEGQPDAGVPVLFMRVSNGRLIQPLIETYAQSTQSLTIEPASQLNSLERANAKNSESILAAYVVDGVPRDLEHRSKLLRILSSDFSLEELKSLCFELGIDFDDLSGEGKKAKARELVGYFERRRQIEKLVKACVHLRPDAPWLE